MKKEKGRGGIILSTASVAGLDGFYGMPVYSATKHAVIGLNRTLGVSNFTIMTSAFKRSNEPVYLFRLTFSTTNMGSHS